MYPRPYISDVITGEKWKKDVKLGGYVLLEKLQT